ncbi:MAG: hypothetical protein QM715_18950 [Nibricoccus sp.]
MPESPFVQPQQLTAEDKKVAVETTPGVANGAKWFWWIAGLSLVNTVLIHSGSDTSFVVGLGLTLMADALFQSVKAIAFAIDAVALGFFFLMGLLSLRGHFWAFIVGAVVYAGDALIYLYFGDFMSVAFHGLALFYIVKGAIGLRTALQEAQLAPAENSGTAPIAPSPSESPKL